MKKTIQTIVLAMLCLFFKAEAQSQISNIKPLKIGDTIPEAIWNMPLRVINHPEGKQRITLNDYRDKKLIILDFWATWCSPCVASLDKLIPIYNKYAQDIALLPVASHDLSPEKTEERMIKLKWELPSIFDKQKVLYSNAFRPPYGTGIPYQVWIKNGKIFAVPHPAYATEENIKKIIHGEPVNILMREADLQPLDYNKPLFAEGNSKTDLYFRNKKYSVIARYLPGYGTGRKTAYLQNGDTTIVASINRTLKDLSFDAYRKQIFVGLTASNGIVWEISDSLNTRLFNGPKYDKSFPLESSLAWQKWLKLNTYGYNLRYPERISEKEALYFMQQDLERFFGFYLNLTFKIENAVKHRYAVIYPSKSKEQTIALLKHNSVNKHSNTNQKVIKYSNRDYSQVFLQIVSNALPNLTIPNVIDSTGIDQNLAVDFEFPKQIMNDSELLIKELKRYGLDLRIQERYVPVLKIKQITPQLKTKQL